MNCSSELKGVSPPKFLINPGESLDLENVFSVFKTVQNLTDSPEAVTLATQLTIKEFAEDGVKTDIRTFSLHFIISKFKELKASK